MTPMSSGLNRLATLTWSVAVGLVGFFVGLIFLGGFHTFDNWQVGLAGFVSALALAIPTAIAISRVAATAARGAGQWLAGAGMLFFAATLFVYARIVFH